MWFEQFWFFIWIISLLPLKESLEECGVSWFKLGEWEGNISALWNEACVSNRTASSEFTSYKCQVYFPFRISASPSSVCCHHSWDLPNPWKSRKKSSFLLQKQNHVSSTHWKIQIVHIIYCSSIHPPGVDSINTNDAHNKMLNCSPMYSVVFLTDFHSLLLFLCSYSSHFSIFKQLPVYTNTAWNRNVDSFFIKAGGFSCIHWSELYSGAEAIRS